MSKTQDIGQFQVEVWQYYDQHGRHDLPWRIPESDGSFDPYKIMVSELMLQQTQVNRVIPKYLAFLELFPSAQVLAEATLGEVLIAWQGLGYNRRAKFLWQAAQMVVNEYDGVFPGSQKELTKLPGVGTNTAGAIMAYAYNKPAVFLETNIRTVYIHHFFDDQGAVTDQDITKLVEQTVPGAGVPGAGLQKPSESGLEPSASVSELATGPSPDIGPRQWYWALMDYGTYIKQTHGNKSRASKSYAKQSPFQGSKRQVRGAVIRYLSQRPATLQDLAHAEPDARLTEVINELLTEDMVREDQGYYRLA